MPQYLDTWSRPGHAAKNAEPSMLSRGADILRTLGLVSGLDAQKLALYVDTSHWNGKLDLAKMPIPAIMAKCSDGKQVQAGSVVDLNTYVDDMFSDTVQQAYDTGKGVIAYPYWQPDVIPTSKKDNDRQYQAMLYALRNKKPGVSFHEIRIDVEEKSIAYHSVVRDRLQTFYAWVKEDFGELIPVSIYTSTGYLESVPAVRDWIMVQKIDVHYAQWVRAASKLNPRVLTTWEKLKAEIIPTLRFNVINYAGWTDVQWSNLYYGLAGINGEVDLNFHNGDEDALRRRLKMAGSQPPPPPPGGGTPGTGDPTPVTVEQRLKTLEDRYAAQQAELIGIQGRLNAIGDAAKGAGK